jgi:lipopolysaccharide transport system permease protein
MNERLHTIIEPPGRLALPRLRELWEYRDLLRFLAWRDVAVKYKQTVLGAGWAVLQPLLTTVIFTLILGRVARLESEGVPYAVFVFSGLLVWQLFAAVLQRVSGSLVANAGVLSKVYFPRLIIPAASAAPPVLDLGIGLLVLLVMLGYHAIGLSWSVLMLIPIAALALMLALGLGLWFAALNVRYRDVAHVLPFAVQAGMFASPVLYSSAFVPERYRDLYGLNPMVGIIEAFRWSLLGSLPPRPFDLGVSVVTAVVLTAGGVAFFSRVEETFADVI